VITDKANNAARCEEGRGYPQTDGDLEHKGQSRLYQGDLAGCEDHIEAAFAEDRNVLNSPASDAHNAKSSAYGITTRARWGYELRRAVRKTAQLK
jgi:hypothetical protein